MRRAPTVQLRPEIRRRAAGFTLIELLVVISVIAVLTAGGWGLWRGAKERAAIGLARAELAMLGQMLESYRREYGDYPQTVDSPATLHRALLGRLGPTGAEIAGRSMLGTVRISLLDPAHPDDPDNSWVDPWGRPYQYIAYTRTLASLPPVSGFVLFSYGPLEGREALPLGSEVVPARSGEQGGVISSSALNARNIYAVP